MINFIIYDKDEKNRELYVKVIKNFFYKINDYYKIYEYNIYTNELLKKGKTLSGHTIFIINQNMPYVDGCDLIRIIRSFDNYKHHIIMVTSTKIEKIILRIKDCMLFNIIFNDDNLVYELWNTIKKIYRIITINKEFAFSIFDEIYKIKYDDIYYIEKNYKNDSVTIHTKDDTYIYYSSIKRMEEILKNDPRFLKTHRSCIINLYNLKSYDRAKNIITMADGSKLYLVARNFKNILINRLIYKL